MPCLARGFRGGLDNRDIAQLWHASAGSDVSAVGDGLITTGTELFCVEILRLRDVGGKAQLAKRHVENVRATDM